MHKDKKVQINISPVSIAQKDKKPAHSNDLPSTELFKLL